MDKFYALLDTTMPTDNIKDLTSELKAARKVHSEILLYCQPYLKFMWAARVSSIILDCDFKEVEE
jgi:hypothetical protein